MKGKTHITKLVAQQIIKLIELKLRSSSQEQKAIRDKIRKLGFYASDFGLAGGYTVADFLRVAKITDGSLSVVQPTFISTTHINASDQTPRRNRDEDYVIDLCDAVLGKKASRQHRFDFLKGDAGTPLPVDAYYSELDLVIEYRERQHTEAVKFFDRRQTVSGMNRGEQRKLYDQRRREILPKHGINLIEISFSDFQHDRSKRIIRDKEKDSAIIKKLLKNIRKNG